jgi:hypothetical protein
MKIIGRLTALILFSALLVWPQTVTHGVLISWTASTTPGVTYNLLHSTTATGTFTVVNSAPITTTSYFDTVNTGGFWEVVAVDASGDVSLPSNQPTVPNAPTGAKAVAQ